MPVSFWMISILVFIAVSIISVLAAYKFYRKELKQEWEQQKILNSMTLLRGALSICTIVTIIIMLCVKGIFY